MGGVTTLEGGVDVQAAPSAIDAAHFRRVLGHFPTGVAVITARQADGSPAGMAVGSFTSVSLDPPLVAFLPDRSSTSWPRIRATGSFCVNVLTHAQEHICRAMASKAPDKFAGLGWRPAGSGSPVLDGVTAWIDCDIESVTEAGDHFIVVGRVRELDVADTVQPLVFYRGGYGRFSPRTVAANDADLVTQLAIVDLARGRMDALSQQLDVEVLASAVVRDEIVLVASAGGPRTGKRPTRVGSRLPFLPPVGYVFAAWADDRVVDEWVERSGTGGDHRERLARVRERGVSLSLAGPASREFEIALGSGSTTDLPRLITDTVSDYEPADPGATALPVHMVAAPVFGPDGSVALALALYGVAGTPAADLAVSIPLLTEAADLVTAAIGGRRPA